tara:strand:- start:2417 stop:3169 length:753 start_codon:yes stop_codon:yes gene_type:complete
MTLTNLDTNSYKKDVITIPLDLNNKQFANIKLNNNSSLYFPLQTQNNTPTTDNILVINDIINNNINLKWSSLKDLKIIDDFNTNINNLKVNITIIEKNLTNVISKTTDVYNKYSNLHVNYNKINDNLINENSINDLINNRCNLLTSFTESKFNENEKCINDLINNKCNLLTSFTESKFIDIINKIDENEKKNKSNYEYIKSIEQNNNNLNIKIISQEKIINNLVDQMSQLNDSLSTKKTTKKIKNNTTDS